MLKNITKLAKKFSSHLTKKADIDALESYPGEDSSNQKKLESAQNAIIDDLTNISNTYYMYESQYEQSKKQMSHQSYLLQFAKKVQELIADMIRNGSQIDPESLRNKLTEIEEESKIVSKKINLKISLSELHSLRLLKAFLYDEVAKTYPKVSLPNWVELSRQRHNEDETLNDESTETLTEDDFLSEDPANTERVPGTLKSPGILEHTNTLKM